MPMAPRRPCLQPGCAALVDAGYCDQHRKARTQTYDRQRGSARARGYDGKWEKARKAFLLAHPLCATCESMGVIVAATVVDHKVPHKGDLKLFWSRSNWQPLCKPCHDRKTATADGRWARRTS